MSHDTLIHRAVRPAVRVLARAGATPDQLTALRLATGIVAAGLFAVGGDPWPDVGAGLFLVSLLLDRADGELARRTGRFSAHGHRLDLLADCLCNALAFVGLGWGLRDLMAAAPWLGVAAGVAVAAVFHLANRRGAAPVRGFASRGRGVVVDPDDAMALLPLLVWADHVGEALVLAATLTPLLAAGLAWAAARRMRAAGPAA